MYYVFTAPKFMYRILNSIMICLTVNVRKTSCCAGKYDGEQVSRSANFQSAGGVLRLCRYQTKFRSLDMVTFHENPKQCTKDYIDATLDPKFKYIHFVKRGRYYV